MKFLEHQNEQALILPPTRRSSQALGLPAQYSQFLHYARTRSIINHQHQTLPIIAVQWHPERMTGDHRYNPEGPDMNLLFEHFVHACGGN